MARTSKHRGAFVTGLLLGGAAAAAAAIWNSPQSGRKTREQLMETVEDVLFKVLGAGEATIARVLTPEAPAPAVTKPIAAEPVRSEPVSEPEATAAIPVSHTSSAQ